MAGLLHTNQTHKQLFISQSPLGPPPHANINSLSITPYPSLCCCSTPTLHPKPHRLRLQPIQPVVPPCSLRSSKPPLIVCQQQDRRHSWFSHAHLTFRSEDSPFAAFMTMATIEMTIVEKKSIYIHTVLFRKKKDWSYSRCCCLKET